METATMTKVGLTEGEVDRVLADRTAALRSQGEELATLQLFASLDGDGAEIRRAFAAKEPEAVGFATLDGFMAYIRDLRTAKAAKTRSGRGGW